MSNSIFQQNLFKSGASDNGGGVTKNKQEHIYENKKYIDTPGLADPNLRKQAAKEIEEALKENNNYKIIFVATLEAGRIREADLVTINTVCEAIKVNFEYGIIFNKVTNPVIRKIGENGENLGSYLTNLRKQPSSTIIIKYEGDMHDEDDVHLTYSSDNRKKLLSFISGLQANMILVNNVQSIDVLTYEEKVREMEIELTEKLKEAEERAKIERKEYEERLNREAEARRIAEQLKTIVIQKTCKSESQWNGTSTIIIQGNTVHTISQRTDDPYIKEVTLKGTNLSMVLWGSGPLNASITIDLNQANHHFNLHADIIDIYVK